jgi:hypothetical protein
MPKIDHSSSIDWPNGMGYTPCSAEYAAAYDAAEAIKPNHINMDDLSQEDYQAWNVLQDKLATMQRDGHLGKSVKF